MNLTDVRSQLQRLLEDDAKVAWNLWSTLRKEHGPNHFAVKNALATVRRVQEALAAFKEDDGDKLLKYLKIEYQLADLAVDRWMKQSRDAEGRDFFLFDLGMRLGFLERFKDQW